MYDEDDEFLRSIPPFLRRYQEPPPRKLPIRPRDLPAIRGQAKSRPAPIATPTVPKVVEIARPLGPAAQRARIALAFENQDTAPATTQDTAQGTAQDTARDTNPDDVTFRVSLPRSVARQICMLAAEQDITQRAVVLHALGLAGLSLPEGNELDRPDRPERPDRAAVKRQA